jgi:hypothetical protein
MRKFKTTLFTSVFSLLFYSCDPCYGLKCASDNYYGQFRIVRATDGADLVFGASRICDKNLIKFYSFKNTDTIFFDYQTIKFSNIGYDSILYVRFFPKTDVAYMRLGNGDIDTLQISYKTLSSRCCGTITGITNFLYNNSVNIPGDNGTQELKK